MEMKKPKKCLAVRDIQDKDINILKSYASYVLERTI